MGSVCTAAWHARGLYCAHTWQDRGCGSTCGPPSCQIPLPHTAVRVQRAVPHTGSARVSHGVCHTRCFIGGGTALVRFLLYTHIYPASCREECPEHARSPRQYWLFTPESQRQPRGKWCISQGGGGTGRAPGTRPPRRWPARRAGCGGSLWRSMSAIYTTPSL